MRQYWESVKAEEKEQWKRTWFSAGGREKRKNLPSKNYNFTQYSELKSTVDKEWNESVYSPMLYTFDTFYFDLNLIINRQCSLVHKMYPQKIFTLVDFIQFFHCENDQPNGYTVVNSTRNEQTRARCYKFETSEWQIFKRQRTEQSLFKVVQQSQPD